MFHHIIQTPIGYMQAETNGQEITGLLFHDIVDYPPTRPQVEVLARLENELLAYFSGVLRVFTVPFLSKSGVLDSVCKIPYGETRSYKEIAEISNSSPRGVGASNRGNPILILVPCHRVIATSGELGGYSGGAERKRWLIEFEKTRKWESGFFS